ncbi:MAG: hypothetical protein JWM62_1558, partial [Frankiales bacterium]|nr:hypothetical protein [Frankiales bacterium]
WSGWVPALARRLAWPAAAGVVTLAAFAWFVRPAVQVARDIPVRFNPVVAQLQESAGLPVDVPRSYDEATMQWLSWYLGPVSLALGVLGLAYLLHRVLRGHDPRAAPFVLLAVLVTAVYVWKPAIFPVQYWATRRFLPVSFPALLLGAVLLCQRLWEHPPRQGAHGGRSSRHIGQVAAAVGTTAVLVFPLALLPGATLPRNYDGFEGAITTLCNSLLPDDVVLILGGGAPGSGLPHVVRGHCGVIAASAGTDSTPEDIADVAAAARAAGRRLVLLSGRGEPELAPPGTTPFRPVFDVTVPTTALELAGRPDTVYPYRVLVFQAVL